MIDIPQPPKGEPGGARRTRLNRAPPKADTAPDNVSQPSDEGYQNFVDMNFKVSARFHKRFKLEATIRSISMKELLEASFDSYLEKNGGTLKKPRMDLMDDLEF